MKWSFLALLGLSSVVGLFAGKVKTPVAPLPERADGEIKKETSVESLVENVDVDRFQKENILLVASNHIN